MKIYAVHLLNDYSGSPKVLMQLVRGWTRGGFDVTVVTSSGRDGFLSNLPGASYIHYWYRWAAHPLLRLLCLSASQLHLFWKLLRYAHKNDIIYINTVLPFGAAFAGKLKGCRVIYHVHETTMSPRVLKAFLFGVMRWAAADVVYVSSYLAKAEPVSSSVTHVLYNAIENVFLEEARKNIQPERAPQNVLMICSLKRYKGVEEFFALAVRHPDLSFRLVVNASQVDIQKYLGMRVVPSNLELFPVQSNVHPFYQWADVVVNLSRPDQWIETFGLTIIEGMAYGLPSIVPPVGGIAELVEEGMNGFHADSRNIEEVSAKLGQICTPRLYAQLQAKARRCIERYREDTFIHHSISILKVQPVE